MFKTKTKLSLIDDYIKLCHINYFCKYYLDKPCDVVILNILSNMQSQTNKMINKYESIFFRIGYINSSFILLKRQLLCSNYLYFAEIDINSLIFIQEINKKLQIIKEIKQNLCKKLKSLCFNAFEINYLQTNDII